MIAQLAAFSLFHDAQRGRRQILFRQRLADADALRMQKRVGHAAADHERVDLADEIFQQIDLGGNLGAADDRDHGFGRRFQRLAQRVEFGLHGAPGIGRQLVAEAFGRGVRAVRGREGVVDPDVAELCQFRDEGRIVLLFFLVEAGVFQTEDVAVLHRGDRLRRRLADAILGERDRLLDHLRERFRHRLQRLLGIASLGPAEMREQDHLAALAGNLRDGRRDALEPRRVGDAAVLHGDVEVDAQQHAFALYVDVIEGAEGFCHWRVSCPGRMRREAARCRTGTHSWWVLALGSRLCEAALCAASRPGHET